VVFQRTPLGLPDTGTNYSSRILTNVGTNQAGNYWVQVVNGYGSLTSSNATLTVVALPPTITTQPLNRTNKAGTHRDLFGCRRQRVTDELSMA